jgi:hypothetical protein
MLPGVGLADDIETATRQRLRQGATDQLLVAHQNDRSRPRNGTLLRWHLDDLSRGLSCGQLPAADLPTLQGTKQGPPANSTGGEPFTLEHQEGVLGLGLGAGAARLRRSQGRSSNTFAAATEPVRAACSRRRTRVGPARRAR